MATQLQWVDTSWPGKLALTSRPRGGGWLAEEMAAWRRAGIDVVVSLSPGSEAEVAAVLERAGAALRFRRPQRSGGGLTAGLPLWLEQGEGSMR